MCSWLAKVRCDILTFMVFPNYQKITKKTETYRHDDLGRSKLPDVV